MKNKKLVLAIGLVAVLAAGIVFNNYWQHRNYKQPTPEQVATAKKAQADAIAEMKEKDRILKQPVCNEPITVTIADMTLVMPRGWATEFRVKDGQVFDHMNRKCDIKKLDNVVAIRQVDFSIFEVEEDTGYRDTSYKKYLAEIQEKRDQGFSTLLSDGIEELRYKEHYIFVVPHTLIPTANDEPVMFDCPGVVLGKLEGASNCTTRYLYKNNLGIWYRFFGTRGGSVPNFGLYEQLKADKYYRNLLESWIRAKK